MKFVKTTHHCYDDAGKVYTISEIKEDRIVLVPVNNKKVELHTHPSTFLKNYWIQGKKINLIN